MLTTTTVDSQMRMAQNQTTYIPPRSLLFDHQVSRRIVRPFGGTLRQYGWVGERATAEWSVWGYLATNPRPDKHECSCCGQNWTNRPFNVHTSPAMATVLFG